MHGITTPRTPKTPKTHRTPESPKTPPPSKMCVFSVAESPVAGSSREHGMGLRGSPFRSPARKTPLVETPTKESPVRSPLKGILRTPVKALVECHISSGLYLLNSPISKTPKKSVTWSPSPRKCRAEGSVTFKVPESPRTASRTSPRLAKTPNEFSSPVKSTITKIDIFKTPEKTANSVAFTQEKNQKHSEKLHNEMKTAEKGDTVSLLEMHPPQSTPPKPNTRTQSKTPIPTDKRITRSGQTPGKNSSIASPCKPVFTTVGGTTNSEGPNTSVKSPAKSLTKPRSSQGAGTTRHILRSQSSENVPSQLKTESAEKCNLVEKNMQSESKDEVQAKPSRSSETDSSSHTDSQPFDSSCFNSASTDDDSMDIVDAAVVKTQLSGGIKMNISFSRKPSMSSEDFLLNAVSPKSREPPQGTPSRSYGFRQTPDRQQREAAARLGYGNKSPRFSTPRGPARLSQQKSMGTPNPLTYQVEMEMQTSGLPKLKIRRTDSMNAGDLASDGGSRSGARSPLVVVKPSQLESPLALFSKHRDPGCVSPSVCTHVTPAKSTPGKGGSVQTYICQSYTPTHHHAGTMSPVATADIIPLTPSPQSVGKVTPDNFNSWPRRKRAQTGVVGGKDRGLKGEPFLVELLEEAELGVSKLQDVEDTDELSDNKTALLALTSKRSPPVKADASPLSPLEGLYWMEKLAEQADCADPQREEEDIIWAAGNGDVKSSKLWFTNYS